jgi:hypothetical protein
VGLFIHCEDPPQQDEVVKLTIDIHAAADVVEANAEVVWSSAGGPGDRTALPGVGVRLLKILDIDLSYIAYEVLDQLDAAGEDMKSVENLRNIIKRLYQQETLGRGGEEPM